MLDAISGFGSALFSMLDTAVSSSDRRQANELNYWATMDTNKTNADINESQLAAARENWQREQQNFELQRKWALEDRDYENWYNLPSNVRDRYLRAGINPVLAMQGSGSGLGASSASTKQAPSPQFGSPPNSIPMQAAHFEPTYNGGIGLGIQKAIDTYMMAQRNETDIAAIRQRLDNETAETKAKIDSMVEDQNYKRSLIKSLDQDTLFNHDSYNERMRSIALGNARAEADIEYSRALTYYQDLINKFTPEQQKVILREYDARYNEIMSAVRKNDSESALNSARKAVEEANKKGVDISNENLEKMSDSNQARSSSA